MKLKKATALLLALLLVLPCSAPAFAAEQEVEIHISTVEQLQKLAVDCTLDSFSEGLKVVLDNDLDLSGVEFHPIPSFSGCFDGGGHSISGMNPATDGSHQGLFRYIQAEGVVRDLKVEGKVSPASSRASIGGIAGTNYGTISNCSFDGTVEGLNMIGGIAGENYGSIDGCAMSGSVSGKRYTGGIAGYSTGYIGECKNSASINTSITEGGLELSQLNLADIVNPELTSAEDADVVSDSGGVAGYSSGVLSACRNDGEVGYPHYGYNVGGIVGRQAGYVNQCENYGQVLGRKDVGGIVGQMEPFLQLKSAMTLSGELYTLNQLTTQAMGNLSGMSQQMNDVLNGINNNSSSALDKLTGNNGETANPGTVEASPTAAGAAEPTPGETAEPTAGETSDPTAGEPTAPGTTDPGTSAPGTTDPGTTDPGTGGGTDLPQLPDVNLPGDISSADLSNMRESMNQLAVIMSNSTGDMAEDMVAVGQQLSRVIMLMASALSGANMTAFEDVSEDQSADEVNGRVAACVNNGAVEGDSNVGGIAGTMAIEYEFDMEGVLSKYLGSGSIISSTFLAKCICSDDINNGSITAKKDNCGGVAGLADVGTVYACQGYGSVESLEGSCIGGLVGRSNTSVRDSYAMCSVEGTEYVGGIAGYATELSGCVSLVGIDDLTACSGAIAGWADMTAQDAVHDNIFVHESLGAVDGISYLGKASAVSYDELMQREGLPEAFTKLTLRFVSDGRLIKEIEFSYGGDVDTGSIPPVPEKEGYSGHWPDYNYVNLRFSDTIEAVYTPRQAAVAADRQRENSPMSLLLLEGDFEDSTKLSLNEYSGDGPDIPGDKLLEKWALSIEGSEIPQGGYTVRYLPPEGVESVDIYVYDGEQWSRQSTARSGSYTTFSASEESLVFCAASSEQEDTALTALIIVIAVALLMTVFVLIRRRRAGRKKPQPSAAE